MYFTSYYATQVLYLGVPTLNKEQHKRLLNILIIENLISELKTFNTNGQANKRLQQLHKKLQILTRGMQPNRLLENMVYQSVLKVPNN
ncbi:hypothetical protein M0G43_11495 [Subsaxibacter sp. CAU 1640]|uniref:hypothetical protein n=1 Tax=Subsaxibacter sp. CAU 1640 TaxID=2933271 RepID=UPI0020051EAB|nr:hypothetical protein [Subsaxibacter sp. CAU 1640]MCK7591201.1 hypothetical protein [Subsaxibacter sp. CAU 1640]